MRVVVLGVGGLGRIIALELASDPRVTELILADHRGERSRALRPIGRTAVTRALELDVRDANLLRRTLADVDLAVNATLPDYNLAVMSACLEAGCGYLDPWGLSPVRPGERPGVLDQLEFDEAWKNRGQTAVVSMGSDPGISNIMARAAADRLKDLEEIRILKAASGGGAIDGYPLYSRSVFLRDALSQPTVWEDGKLVTRPFVSAEEDYEFPPPIGTRHLYLFYHEEVMTLPLRLGRPLPRVCYKHDIKPDLVRAIVSLDALGLLAEDRRLPLAGSQSTFRDAFLATFPEPSTLIGPFPGSVVIVAEAIGTKEDGTRVRVRGSIVVDHREANRRRGTTAERYLSSAAVAAVAGLIAAQKALRPGVLAPEELPPDLILPELERRGVRFTLDEQPA